MTKLNKYIRTVSDFPIEGVQFRDITSLLETPEAFTLVNKEFEDICNLTVADCIVGIESRGFIFGSTIASSKNIPFILARKPGKLPNPTYRKEYELEYGTSELHIQKISPIKGNVIIIDDLIATGGTAITCADLIHENFKIPKKNILILAVIDLPNLGGSAIIKQSGYDVRTLTEFEGE
jgi:adenine phosphoribosyltransferase